MTSGLYFLSIVKALHLFPKNFIILLLITFSTLNSSSQSGKILVARKITSAG